jgi:hypothetical protein
MLCSLAKQLREGVVKLLCTLSALELPQQLQDYTTRLASNGAESAESAVRERKPRNLLGKSHR